ncbi:hypothetical protein SODALDRAFT_360115 [Sodiomyces alkalinus F11]|uniref:Uncharacterized protein n=1 Tax=Sodiomyces alkalinus (strain CBS 110278 / VKM F-3762 / F11) TaxID=1314773 RepID=A0A3N2PTR0_SODAK|nr:hypothetical protein SODALDRAFT_360115 [Sodiomyces alkalinus F11]ROT37824.1 hypothetical protein SODALDRAFT_360115 [Sodiomyces alkalinus F11]
MEWSGVGQSCRGDPSRSIKRKQHEATAYGPPAPLIFGVWTPDLQGTHNSNDWEQKQVANRESMAEVRILYASLYLHYNRTPIRGGECEVGQHCSVLQHATSGVPRADVTTVITPPFPLQLDVPVKYHELHLDEYTYNSRAKDSSSCNPTPTPTIEDQRAYLLRMTVICAIPFVDQPF